MSYVHYCVVRLFINVFCNNLFCSYFRPYLHRLDMSSENRPTDQINSSVIYDVTRARAAVFENRSIPQPPVKNSSNRDAGNGGTNSPSAAARKPRKTPALESVEYEVPEGLAMGTTVKKGVADVEEYQVVDLHGPTVDDADVSRTETQEGAEPKVEPVQGKCSTSAD